MLSVSTRVVDTCGRRLRRTPTDGDPRSTVLSIDGMRTHNHVLCSAITSEPLEILGLRGHLPFVRSNFAAPSCHHWEDQDAVRQQVWQHGKGEQACCLSC